MSVTPSQNRIFKFTFPTSVTQVAITSKSPDDVCLTVSVQSPKVSPRISSFLVFPDSVIRYLKSYWIQCPIFDTIYNVEYEGFRQTMTGQSTIIVQVILIYLSNNYSASPTMWAYYFAYRKNNIRKVFTWSTSSIRMTKNALIAGL